MLIRYTKKNVGGYYSKKGKTLRKADKIRKGVLIAVPVSDDRVRIGWSLCNFSMEDEFTDLGMKIAIERAETSSTVPPAHSIMEELKKFIQRARTYYKDKEVEITFPLIAKNEDQVAKSLVEMALEA